ncbi:RiPP maturation radical SAM C-methyltransferase [Pelagibius sp. Alg239-R121]|uniref:RiPP maturation radical SAM C-methyltransferase n=1 Tax=Pelagibius sp. Alg239-R121 TaxID=2993448 RepID=UPI0024A65834|nr:RiPP maturation radical SAM C-methyltransferase [Pelagibius sp. Alg239-R121]
MALFLPDSLNDRCDVLLIDPPFAAINRPSIGLHLLQALARRNGASASVLYANLLFAAEIGEAVYQDLCYLPTGPLVGERIFAHLAFDGAPRNIPSGALEDANNLTHEKAIEIQELAGAWLDGLADCLAKVDVGIVGCSTTFEQTAFSLALLRRLKARRPDVITILGGANCESEMGIGLHALSAGPDYVFSGESEESFVEFVEQFRGHRLPPKGVIEGSPCKAMDALPVGDYSEFFDQFSMALPDSEIATAGLVRLPMETSRGCWWGQKHHCTFCGLNGHGMSFREKSPRRAVSEIETLLEAHDINKIFMVDNIMPHKYFETLLPLLIDSDLDLELFYEQKANLGLRRMLLLRDAGVMEIQPGIEALTTSLLRRMRKGVSAAQNIETLQLARSLGISVNWNLLFGFPGDDEADYAPLISLIPLLRHLQPPGGFGHISIDRFSPYFTAPTAFGIDGLQPLNAYGEVFPGEADLEKIAYHFVGDYRSLASQGSEIIESVANLVDEWRAAWEGTATPSLFITRLTEETFLLVDTRGLPGLKSVQFIDRGKALVALLGKESEEHDRFWALDNKVVVYIDGNLVPLAAAPRDLLVALDSGDNTQSVEQSRDLELALTVT